MKNDFIIRGKEATLFVEAPPNVGYGSVEVKLDAVDMDLVKSWPGTWFSFIHKSNGQLYIRATAHRVGGKVVNVPGFEQKQPLLHRVISKPERGQNTIFSGFWGCKLRQVPCWFLRYDDRFIYASRCR